MINNLAEKPLYWSINDSVQETAIIIDAAARASAKEVTVIKPYFAYSRQDRKSSGRESVAAAVHMKQYQNVGMDRLVTVDLHSPQIGSMHQWFDNLSGANRLTKVVQTYAEDNGIELDDTVFVAPDGGSLKLPNFYVDRIKHGQAAVMQKTRQSDGAATHHAQRLDGFGGRTAVLVDDMIDTAGTVVSAAEILSRSGADKIILAATHGLFSDPALERLEKAEIDKIIVTDTVPQDQAQEALGDRLIVQEIGSLIGKAIFEIGTDGSVSSIFENNTLYRR